MLRQSSALRDDEQPRKIAAPSPPGTQLHDNFGTRYSSIICKMKRNPLSRSDHYKVVSEAEAAETNVRWAVSVHPPSLSREKGHPPGYIEIANTWLIVNVGGGPTPEKPTVTLSVPADPDLVSGFMNIRVADIQACYKLWRSRGAAFITEPKEQYGETCCYIRDPDGYIIEVGQSKPGFAYG